MNPKQLVIRCYAKQEQGSWVAVCLEFTLAAQGDSFEEVKAKLEDMISDYVYDALVGEDVDYASQLLTRSAPVWSWIEYYKIKLTNSLFHSASRIFEEMMPLRPA